MDGDLDFVRVVSLNDLEEDHRPLEGDDLSSLLQGASDVDEATTTTRSPPKKDDTKLYLSEATLVELEKIRKGFVPPSPPLPPPLTAGRFLLPRPSVLKRTRSSPEAAGASSSKRPRAPPRLSVGGPSSSGEEDPPQRSGTWTPEEEIYSNRVADLFRTGSLPNCPEGATLRNMLANLLNCTPMRISKKYCGYLAIGKRGFRRGDFDLSKVIVELSDLEKKFHRSIKVRGFVQLKLSLFGTSGLPTPVAIPVVPEHDDDDDVDVVSEKTHRDDKEPGPLESPPSLTAENKTTTTTTAENKTTTMPLVTKKGFLPPELTEGPIDVPRPSWLSDPPSRRPSPSLPTTPFGFYHNLFTPRPPHCDGTAADFDFFLPPPALLAHLPPKNDLSAAEPKPISLSTFRPAGAKTPRASFDAAPFLDDFILPTLALRRTSS